MDDPWRIMSELGTDATMTGLWCAAKACGVLAGAGFVALAMRRRAAATRHLVWVLGLAGALAVLPLSLAVPRWGVPVLEAPPRTEPAIVSSPLLEAQPLEVPTVTEMAMPANMAVATLQAISPIETNVDQVASRIVAAGPLDRRNARRVCLGRDRLGFRLVDGKQGGSRHRPDMDRRGARGGRAARNAPSS